MQIPSCPKEFLHETKKQIKCFDIYKTHQISSQNSNRSSLRMPERPKFGLQTPGQSLSDYHSPHWIAGA